MLQYTFIRDTTSALLLSASIGIVLLFPIYRMLLKIGSKQNVSEHLPEHQTKQGTPTMGGILIVLATGIALSVFGKGIWMETLGFLMFALIGFVDDYVAPRKWGLRRGLSWRVKLFLQTMAAGVMSANLGNLVGRGFLEVAWWIYAFAIFVILFMCNAYNFADGLDGLAGTVGVGICLGLAGVCFIALPIGSGGVISGAICGALIAFLFLNAPPAKVFMGDVGSLPVGALIGLVLAQLLVASPVVEGIGFQYLSVRGVFTNASDFVIGWEIVVPALLISIVMIAELVPVPLQILSVKVRKRKVFLKTPIHHAFEAMGVPETRIVYAFALVQLLFSMAAILSLLFGLGQIAIMEKVL